MIKQISKTDFIDAFQRAGRGEQFTHNGLEALYNYLEQYEEETGEQVELDVIALCCDYTEYKSLEDLQTEYEDITSMEDLEDHTIVIPVSGDRFIIQAF